MPKKSSLLTETIYELAINNSEVAYRLVFDQLFNPLKRFAFHLLRSREQAEEIASDVMFTLWQRREDLLQVENIKSYAFIIARNLSLNLIKKQLKADLISLDDINLDVYLDYDTPEQLLLNTELKEKIEKTINLLPAKGKLVFKLIKEDGFSYKEVGEILDISPKTVDAHLVAALKKITGILNKEFNLI